MAQIKQQFAGGHLTIATVDISDYIKTVEFKAAREVLLSTTSGDVGETRIYGLYDWSCNVTLTMDTTLETLLWGVLTQSTAKAFAYRADQAARGTTNPDYVAAECIIAELPIGGTVGQEWTTTVTFMQKNGIAIIRTASA